MGCVALLPQELAGAEERRRLFHLPTYDAAPLVQPDGKVAMGLHPVGEGRIHGGFARRPDGNGLVDVLVSELGHPRQLRGKVVEVVLLFFDVALGNEHREIAILHANQLDFLVEPPLDQLPNSVRPLPQDETSLDGILLDELALHDDLLIPARRVLHFFDLYTASLRGLLHQSRLRCRPLLGLLRLFLFGFLLLLLSLGWLRRLRRRGRCRGRFRRAARLQLRQLGHKLLDVGVFVDLLAAHAL
mmetsp:Transcript_93708/g.264499  ORF Transcript_93708/g.264499 Transcript_93708/m.264499 type:complete len:244 (+) Transcript_93708:1159-1890(+)